MPTFARDRTRIERPIPDEAYVEPRAAHIRDIRHHFGDLLTRGAVAGLAAGLAFLLANMAFATSEGKPAVAPLMDISTIFHGTDQPAATQPTLDMIATGTTVHLGLTILYGMVFAVLVGAVAIAGRNAVALAIAGVVYGLALYAVNFQVLGNLVFEWFTNPKGPDQGFEVIVHAAYGLLLAPFFIGVLRRPAAA